MEIIVVLALCMVAALAGCADEPRLSIAEARTCASQGFEGHSGTFMQRGNNGPTAVIVTFDEGRRPIRTFYESAPHGSHRELTDAAQAIKDCVANGRLGRTSV